MRLDATAEYSVNGDGIQAEIFIFDETTEIYHPEYVKEGFVQFQYNGHTVKEIDFTKFNGNSDGSIKIYYNHPSRNSNLSMYVEVELEDDTIYDITVPVTQDNMDDTIPLTEQPEIDSTDEYRSQKRINEENL